MAVRLLARKTHNRYSKCVKGRERGGGPGGGDSDVRGERGDKEGERSNHKTPSSGKVLQANLPSFNECNSNVGIKVFILKLFPSFISLEQKPQSR